MVATQNIDILGPIWKFSLWGVLTFVASGLDIHGCLLGLHNILHATVMRISSVKTVL